MHKVGYKQGGRKYGGLNVASNIGFMQGGLQAWGYKHGRLQARWVACKVSCMQNGLQARCSNNTEL